MDARSFSDNALKQRTVLQAQRGAANYYTDITQEICRLCPLTKWQLAEHSSAKQAGILGVGICVAVSEGVCVCVCTHFGARSSLRTFTVYLASHYSFLILLPGA